MTNYSLKSYVKKSVARLISRPELIILTSAAFITRFWGLFYPATIVWDEVYHKAFASFYYSGNYYFDVHPPLGKLLLAGTAKLLGVSYEQLRYEPAVMVRLLPATLGSLTIPLFYLLLRRLKASRPVATLGALMLLLDGALLVESRFMLIDGLMIFFSLAGLYAFIVSQTSLKLLRYCLISGLLLGMAVSVKWTSLGMVALVGCVLIYKLHKASTKSLRLSLVKQGTIIALAALSVYVISFAVHFALLPSSGIGNKNMSPRFQAGLIGNNSSYQGPKLGFVGKFLELNSAMFGYGEGVGYQNPHRSNWQSWPFNQHSIPYWKPKPDTDGWQRAIYFLGNPVVWWLALGGLAASIILVGVSKQSKTVLLVLTSMWLGYILSFALLVPINRELYTYHYLLPLIFSIGITVLSLGTAAGWQVPSDKFSFNSRNAGWLFWGLCALLIVSFFFFAPLWYGIPLTQQQFDVRIWLNSWR